MSVKAFPKNIINKLNKLRVAMIRYAENKKEPLRNGNYLLPKGWNEDFKWVLRLESQNGPSYGTDTLNKYEMKMCNKLFRKYLGYVK